MLTTFLDAITNLSPKPFLLGGYILFCIAFTVRVFQSWHRTKFSVSEWDFHDKMIVSIASLFSTLTFCLPTIFLLIELAARRKRQKTIEQKFTGTAALRIPTKQYENFEPSGDVRGLCPWAIVPVGELEQHGFHVDPPSDIRDSGKTPAGSLALTETAPGLFVAKNYRP